MKKIAIKPHFKKTGMDRVNDELRRLDPSKGWLVTIEQDNPIRTSSQNRYYRGVVVEGLRKGLEENRIPVPHHVAHEILLCNHFGMMQIEVEGQLFHWPVRRTTTDEYGNKNCITIGDMVSLIDSSIAYAYELGIEIDDKQNKP